jgi:hypothetical protein
MSPLVETETFTVDRSLTLGGPPRRRHTGSPDAPARAVNQLITHQTAPKNSHRCEHLRSMVPDWFQRLKPPGVDIERAVQRPP